MRRLPACFLLLAILLLQLVSTDADAQFGRRSRKERKREAERRENARPPVRKTEPVVERKQPPRKKDYEYPESVIKPIYRIDILAPFYLSELVQDGKLAYKGKIPDKAQPSIYFYEGVKIAIDTLDKLGYKFDIYVHDVSDLLESVETLVNTDALLNSDLIIGMLASSHFPRVAEYAKKHNINFISALSPSDDKVVANPFFTMLQPTLRTHCDAIIRQMEKKYGKVPHVMLYRTTTDADKTAYETLSSADNAKYYKFDCGTMPAREDLEPLFDNSALNVVVMPIISDDYSESIIKKLYEWFPTYKFEIWGMPSWNDMPSLTQADAFPNIVVYFTRPYHFDASTASGQWLTRVYKKSYGGNPNNMVFRGYETMYWYAYLLKKYGNVFNKYVADNGMAPFTRFNIQANKDNDGQPEYNENKHIYLYRYQGSSYMVEQQ